MNTRKYLIKNSLVACLVGCCVSLASAGNPPFFTTDAVLNAKGELLMTQKGTRHLDIFSADGKSLLHSFPFDEIPTGLLPDGDKVYVTTFEKTGRLQVLSLESGRVEAAYRRDREPAIRCSDRIRNIYMYVISSIIRWSRWIR